MRDLSSTRVVYVYAANAGAAIRKARRETHADGYYTGACKAERLKPDPSGTRLKSYRVRIQPAKRRR